MNAFLLAAVLVSQMIIIAVQLWIVNLLTRFSDFSKEDVQVKAMTEQDAEATERVVEAKNRLPRKEN